MADVESERPVVMFRRKRLNVRPRGCSVMLFFLFGSFFVYLIYLFQCNLFQLVFYSVDLQCYLCGDAKAGSFHYSIGLLARLQILVIVLVFVSRLDVSACGVVLMMEIPHYLLLLSRTSLSDLSYLSMEPPHSPKFNLPLWQPWIAPSQKETPSTVSSGESEGDRTLSPETPRSQPKELTGKWRRERRSARLPEYRPRDNCKAALRSQSFNEKRSAPTVARAHTHSDGEFSDEANETRANSPLNGKAPPPGAPRSPPPAPVDMRLRARAAPPPYARPSVIRTGDPPPDSLSMCDTVIEEHFRRSLGDNYMNLFKKNTEAVQPGPKPNTKDRASSPILFKTEEPPKPAKIIAMEVDDPSLSVDDHFAKALGDTWRKIQTSRSKETDTAQTATKGVDDHFTKALGDTWKEISSKHDLGQETPKNQATKIITRSGVVI